LNNLTLFWDDLEEDIKNDPKNLEKYYKHLRKVIDFYFLEQDRANAFRVTKQWVDIETNVKDGPTKKMLCSRSHSYWHYRLIDSGVLYWMNTSAAAY